ncbi:FAD-dependent oxidoreductase [Peribacillus sp. AS_2]|uniref:FAD-binding oxidoreductase n=1 Tax=Peribacillus sp. AS_2 TaxID=2996755 RepID=UPI0022A72F8D|nr:FAD-dependent oxidoreductase [Peribacillus sp. AS_2]MCZ0872704.1 FAD-dependent oxidoreductase [Peribacillus sp. AS_2]
MVSIGGLTGRVVLQGSPGYDEARQNYNGRFNKFPKVIVYCEVTQDVVNAILWARKQQLPFRVRSGGHSYEAFSFVDGGLVIDVSGLLKLQINKEGGTAQIGAGFRLLPLYEALWKHRLTIPYGTCPTIGVSGITLGGGYGLLSRLLGNDLR